MGFTTPDFPDVEWKLAQVLSGSATDALLDRYESERKPVSTDGADWALMAFGNHTVIDAGIGLTPGAPLVGGRPSSRSGWSPSQPAMWRPTAPVTPTTESTKYRGLASFRELSLRTKPLLPSPRCGRSPRTGYRCGSSA